jgi:V8-like Glu-specific endopeptidase
MIVGYPSETYKQQTNIKNVLVNRKALKGYFDHIEAYHAKGKQRLEIINYTMPTSLGFSGSPILAVRDDQLIVIGIHTHRGQQEGINSGVYFD